MATVNMVQPAFAMRLTVLVAFATMGVSGWSAVTIPARMHTVRRTPGRTTLLRQNIRFMASTAAAVQLGDFASESKNATEPSIVDPIEAAQAPQTVAEVVIDHQDVMDQKGDDRARVPFPLILWRFSRPHTLIGSALAIPALHLLAAPTVSSMFSMKLANSALYAMIPSLLMNIYITGLNQVTDVEIDKINKPNLVIPAGVLSRRNAIWTVLTCLAASLWLGTKQASTTFATPGLAFALWGSAILGTMYSLEPFRLKRFPLLAAFCIVAVRGTVINAGFFAHATTAAFGGSAGVMELLRTNMKCLLSSLFFCVFGVVIALMKDVPDVVGDESSNVRTLSVRIGQKRVFHASRKILEGLFYVFGGGFAKGALAAPSSALLLCRGVAGTASVLAGLSVRRESRSVDPEDSKQVYSYYMHLWKLFYLSYLVLPFAR